MAELILGFLIVLASLAGLGLGQLCGRPRVVRACGQSDTDCACAQKPLRRKEAS